MNKRKEMLFEILTILFLLFLSACSATQTVVKQKTPAPKENGLANVFKHSDVLSGSFTGFELYDPAADSVLYAKNAKKYFTPASNTKLYTFFTALNYLPDKIPALRYVTRGDSLIFWGTGDPTFLRKDFKNRVVYNFLKNSPQKLYFSDSNFRDKRFGPGWMWDDYTASWQKERTPLPMYGNLVHFSIPRITTVRLLTEPTKMKISPPVFRSNLKRISKKGLHQPLLDRGMINNKFEYTPQADTSTYNRSIPYHYTPQLITKMLSDTLHKPVTYIKMKIPAHSKMLYSVRADTVYKRMLLPSDNFIAEQLLLTVAAQLGHPLSTRWVINKMEHTYLKGIPDAPQWVDGSGLSRYDLFTPRDMVWILRQIRAKFGNDKKLFSLLPAGGKRGTIRNLYAPRNGGPPYVFAKTGTLSNNHCLSGFIRTKKGHLLIFSLMSNHYVTSNANDRKAMGPVLWYIHTHY